MKVISIAGTCGKDAETRTTQKGDAMCNFSVAVDDGWGESKTTMWFDVTRWGKNAAGLAKILTKGTKVAVSGELTTREHNGKTYMQIRADSVTPQGSKQREPDGSRGSSQQSRGGYDDGGYNDDPADSIPFVSCDTIW